jgi:glycosyltransferase involved in cell wall biosynthesis
MISICIPCHNDQEELDLQIESIVKTATQEYEIVVCDDGSKKLIENKLAKVVVHKNRIGVGAAIDTAVKHSTGDYIVISGSDIVHKDDGWMDKCVEDLGNEPNTVFSTTMIGYDPSSRNFLSRKRYGCDFIIKADLSDIPIYSRGKFPKGWKMLYRSKWYSEKDLPYLKERDYEIPNILGARYFISRNWYNWLKGFNGHRHWGSLDSYLGMKSWLSGGKCKLDIRTEHGHIFGREVSGKLMDWFIYNKVLVTRTLFPDKEKELLEWVKNDRNYEPGVNIANSYPLCVHVEELKDYFQNILLHGYDWYVDKFKLK